MKKHLPFLILILTPMWAYAGVNIGAGQIKQITPVTNGFEKHPEKEEQITPQKIKQQKEHAPLARSVANMFRPELVNLQKKLAENAVAKLPLEKRAKQQKVFENYIDVEHILDLYTQILLDYYTPQELKALRTFLADATGQSVLEKLPQTLNKMQLTRQRHLEGVLNNILQEQVIDPAQKGVPTLLAP